MFVEYGVILVVALAVAFVLQAFVVKPYRIPSPSMVATLEPGDRVLVARVSRTASRRRQRGDIVVFKYPLDTHVVFIKRIIGLPGRHVSLRGGHVYVNGRAAERALRRQGRRPTGAHRSRGTPRRSTMSEPWSLHQPYTVPAGHYFVMGDNRTDSDDSRDWGPVPARDLIGRAFLIYWPLSRIGLP